MNCSTPCRPRRCNTYVSAAVCFLGFVLAIAIGLIIGAYNYEAILPVIAALIAFAAAILVIIIALLIYWHFNRNN